MISLNSSNIDLPLQEYVISKSDLLKFNVSQPLESDEACICEVSRLCDTTVMQVSRLCDTSHTGQKPAKALLCYQLEIYSKSKNIFIRLVKIKSWSPKWDFTPTTTQTVRPVLGMTGCCNLVGKLNKQQVWCSYMSCRVCGGRLHSILVKVVFIFLASSLSFLVAKQL